MDVASLKRGKQSLALVKSTVERQRKKIIALQQRNRRLTKHIKQLLHLYTNSRNKLVC